MMEKADLVKRLIFPGKFEPRKSIPAGLYHYQRESDGTFTRFHLRVEPDGRGILLANASAAARLSHSGVDMIKGFLDGRDDEATISMIARTYHGASRLVIEQDYDRIKRLLEELASPGDNYPITNLEDPALSSHDVRLLAPWHADLECADPTVNVPLLDKLWEAGIPHVTIFARKDFEPEHLILAVERAEDLGMIAGVRGRAIDLSKKGLLRELAVAGIDHVTLIYASSDVTLHDQLLGVGDHALVWQLFEMLQELEVARVAEFPLTRRTITGLNPSLIRLLDAGVSNVNFTAYALPDKYVDNGQIDYLTSSSMPQVASMVEEASDDLDVRFIWQPPVGGDLKLSIQEQILVGPRCSEDTSIRVLSDGEVIPPRGPAISAGNILRDPWQDIWGNKVFRLYRERVERPTRCDECPDMAICAVDCPRKISGWSTPAGGYN